MAVVTMVFLKKILRNKLRDFSQEASLQLLLIYRYNQNLLGSMGNLIFFAVVSWDRCILNQGVEKLEK